MLDKFITQLERVLFAIASVALLASVGLAFYAVVLRYGFNSSLEWIEEAARYLALFAAVVVAGPVLRNGGHVALDLLPSALGGTRQQLHRFASGLIAFAVATGICLWGTQLVIQTFNFGLKTGSLQFPQWLPFAIIPTGMAIVMLFSLVEMVQSAQSIRRGDQD